MEQKLILQAKSGNKSAFDLLIKAYLPRIYNAAFYFVRNMEDAKDICQEVLCKAYLNIKNFDENRPLFPWLHRITKNLCINHLKRYENRNLGIADEEFYPSSTKNPEESVIEAFEAELIKSVIEELPGQQRHILYLKYYEECSYREMAEILDIPTGTVMSRLYNARQNLKERLQMKEEED
jgi:RNA polymerase sigma-70 factor (ECF subfamily)